MPFIQLDWSRDRDLRRRSATGGIHGTVRDVGRCSGDRGSAAGCGERTASQRVDRDRAASRQSQGQSPGRRAANLPLSEGPIESVLAGVQDAARSEKLGDRTAKLVAAYAANYETMDDTKATAFFNEWQSIERDRSALRDK